MKTLHNAEPCQVLLEPLGLGFTVSAVRWRGSTWYVKKVLEVYVYWGEWWLDSSLIGETRVYYLLGTARGELTIFQHQHQAWFVVGWFD